MIIEFTINPTELFNAVMDQTLLDKKRIESTKGVEFGDKFALSKEESDAFMIELDDAINTLCYYIPQLQWIPNDGIEMSIESQHEVTAESVALLVSRALKYLMLYWWYEPSFHDLALLANEQAKKVVYQLRRKIEGHNVVRPYRFF